MNRSSFVVRAARLIQYFPLSILRIIEKPVVNLFCSKNKKSSLIILLALPRSGSTLTYQILCHSLPSIYLSNLSNLFYQLPLAGGVFSKWYCNQHISDFSSQGGFVSGLCGPAEGLRFWTYWFSNTINEPQSSSLKSKKWREEYLQNVFNVLGQPEQPVITGYLGHILVWERLRKRFPEAIFIRLHRSPVENALSLLRCRQKSSENVWFSVCPTECRNHFQETLHEQVAAQVYWLNKRLDNLSSDERTVNVTYEEICENPTLTLQKVIFFCNECGFNLIQKQSLPPFFQKKKIDWFDQDALLIMEAFKKIENKYGYMQVRE